MIDTDTAPVRTSAHADCTHPKTKVARAACRRARRAPWITVTRGDALAVKGAAVRVTVTGDEFEGTDEVEGTLLGWGEKRMIVRDADGDRLTFKTDDVLKVEVAKPADA